MKSMILLLISMTIGYSAAFADQQSALEMIKKYNRIIKRDGFVRVYGPESKYPIRVEDAEGKTYALSNDSLWIGAQDAGYVCVILGLKYVSHEPLDDYNSYNVAIIHDGLRVEQYDGRLAIKSVTCK